MGKLDGRRALVTGASRGIGRGIALAFAAEGADVAVLDVNRKTAEEVAVEIRARGRRALAVEVDVTDAGAVARASAEVTQAFGRLDVLVNNAGWTSNERFAEQPPAMWERIVAVNYVGTLACTHAALRHMLAARRGRLAARPEASQDSTSTRKPPQNIRLPSMGMFSISMAAILGSFMTCSLIRSRASRDS